MIHLDVKDTKHKGAREFLTYYVLRRFIRHKGATRIASKPCSYKVHLATSDLYHIPGKLKARPVQQPATPALMATEEEKLSLNLQMKEQKVKNSIR